MGASMVGLHAKIFFLFFFFFWVVQGATNRGDHLLDYGDDLLFGSWQDNDMASSTFKQNLDFAFQTLQNLSSFTRYAMLSIGSPGEDKVHAMFQCREDLSPLGCMQCVATATATTLLPPFSSFAHLAASEIQLNACYLRYNNRSLITERPRFEYARTSCVKAEVVDTAMVHRAISLASRKGGYAVAHGSNGYVAIAECLGYLSETECAQCLSDAVSYRVTDCFDRQSEMVHFSSCYYRYENSDFLNSSAVMRQTFLNSSVARQPPQQLK